MSLIVKPVFKIGEDKKRIKEMYMAAFPKEDRMPFWLMMTLSKMWHTEFLSFYDEDLLCGFVYVATLRKLTFVMFFGVDENLRSKGYGRCILEQVAQLHPDCKIIVSIEPANQDTTQSTKDRELRLRRKNFYLRNEFHETGYFIKLGGKEQELLIRNGVFDKRQLQLFFYLYSNCTMFPKVWSDSL